MESFYYEIRTATGTVIQQFTTEAVMERWLERRKYLSYLPSYYVFKIYKREELYNVQSSNKATTA